MPAKLYEPVPFKFKVDEKLIANTKAKLKLARFPQQEISTSDDDWSQGTRLKELKRVADYWRDEYNWQEEEVGSSTIIRRTRADVPTRMPLTPNSVNF